MLSKRLQHARLGWHPLELAASYTKTRESRQIRFTRNPEMATPRGFGGRWRFKPCCAIAAAAASAAASRLSPGLPEGAVSITLPEPRTSFTQRHKIRPMCGLAKDDWTTTLQIEIFSSAVKPVMIICFPKPHSPLNSRIIRVLQTVTQDCKFATRPSCQRMLLITLFPAGRCSTG
jgi:hypothetical protein